jgi:hypothetical protein
MQRRDFITLLGGAAGSSFLWQLDARAQQINRMLRIGVSTNADSEAQAQARIARLALSLKERGWGDERNIRIEYRSSAIALRAAHGIDYIEGILFVFTKAGCNLS